MIRFLAMSPSGEAFFTRDQHGIIREHWRVGGLDPLQVSQYVVDRAVLDSGFERVDEDVQTWAEVEAAFERRIHTVDGPLVPTLATARALLPVLDRWLVSPTDRRNVLPIIHRLLREDAIAEDMTLRSCLLDRADRAERSGVRTAYRPSARLDTVTAYLSNAA